MKEIKFRAWNKSKKEMVVLTSNAFKELLLDDCFKALQKDYELMQYTGLKDKNGKEIYEGDVVKLDEERYDIFFDCGEFQGKGIGDSIGRLLQMFELVNGAVIGNIYENTIRL